MANDIDTQPKPIRSAKSVLSKTLARLRSDPFVTIALSTWLALGLAHVLPFDDALVTKFPDILPEIVLLILSVALFTRAAGRAKQAPVRLFWSLIASAFAFWIFARLSESLLAADQKWDPNLVGDLFYLGYYGSILLAIELRLDSRDQPFWLLHRGTAALTGLVLLVAVFWYFWLVPTLSGNPWLQSYIYVYLSLDAFLVIRMIFAASRANSASWRLAYRSMAIMMALITGAELLSWLYRMNYIALDQTSGVNFAWYLWCPAAFLCSLVNVEMDGELEKSSASEQIFPSGNILLIFSLILPVVHLVGYSLGLLDSSVQNPRIIFISVWIVFVIVLLTLFNKLVRSKVVELSYAEAAAKEKALQLEKQLQRAARMGTLSRLSAGLAHDLGNTVSAMSMHARVISQKDDTGDIDRRDIEGLTLGIRFAQDLIDKLRVFASASGRTNSAAVNVHNEVLHTIELIRPSLAPDLSLTLSRTSSNAIAFAEPSDIHQVLSNFVFNAIDAVGIRGEIDVTIDTKDLAETCASCAKQFSGKFLVLTVSDTGPGVAPEVSERLFEPLVTTKSAGSGGGLGLSTVHGMLHRIGGHVGLLNRDCGGCSFSAYFVTGN